MTKRSAGDDASELTAWWSASIAPLTTGKVVGGFRYVHRDALDAGVLSRLQREVARVGGPTDGFNVLKLDPKAPRLSLLEYSDFFERAFPPLARATTIDLSRATVERRSYDPAGNPPILHRKELLLDPAHPRRAEFAALTADAESRGLFADTRRIGHRDQWATALREKGLRVEGHALVALDLPSPEPVTESESVQRHRTAMARRALSTPMQALWRHGLLDAPRTVFDYGCGRGDDLAALTAAGVDARGWDPHFRPEAERVESDVVNLGFVLNVIEDPSERREALTRAFALSRAVLSVSAIVGGRAEVERHRAFGDGVLTSRNTFQKYFGHEELGAFIADALGREPVSVGPGLYFVFRRDEDEQDFLEARQRSSGRFGAMPAPPATERAPRAPRAARVKPPSRWERHAELIEDFWRACLALGRAPREGEFARLGELTRDVGSAATVLRRLAQGERADAMALARARRMGDLSVFFALNLFERRRSAATLGDRARADVREFWGSQAKASESGQSLLFSLRDPSTVPRACAEAAARGLGWLTEGESLQLDARLLNELPPALRVFVGCAGKLYGEASDADVVKVHLGSGKVTLLRYDDFDGSAIPLLVERVKVDLRKQEVSFFHYGGEFAPQPLYFKSRCQHPAMEGYEAQRAFDDALARVKGHDWSGFGPPLEAVAAELARMRPPPGLRVIGPGTSRAAR